MQTLPIEVLQTLMPAVQAIGEHQRSAVREIELPRIDRKGIAAARAAGEGGFSRGHRAIMESVGYSSDIDVYGDDDDDDSECGNCGYNECQCDYHCAGCDVEECGGEVCGCSCGNCDWEADE
jgi:hypothetical protein